MPRPPLAAVVSNAVSYTHLDVYKRQIIYRATVKDGPLRNEVGGSSDEARWVSIRDIKGLRTLSLVQAAMRMAVIEQRGRGSGRRPNNRQAKASKPGK